MNVSEDLKLKINKTFPGEKYEGLRSKLYSLDPKTIQELGIRSQKRIDPKEVLSKNIEELYTKARMLIDLQNLYKHLCEESAKDIEDDNVKY